MKNFFRIEINTFHLEKFFNFLTIIIFLLCLSLIFLNINNGIDFTDE